MAGTAALRRLFDRLGDAGAACEGARTDRFSPLLLIVNMPTRFKATFRTPDSLQAAIAAEAVHSVRLINHKRNIISFDATESPEWLTREYPATLVVDHQYSMELDDPFRPEFLLPDTTPHPSLDDVIDKIQAPAAWTFLGTQGSGVTIAVVDTGVDGARSEFPPARRATGGYAAPGDDPWIDWLGHGTMCASIAAASKDHGGTFNGVAPAAQLLSCKTHFYDAELTAIYDDLAARAQAGERIVVTNSFGTRSGSPPTLPPDVTFPDALRDAIAAGVCAFFSAGNYHELTDPNRGPCNPTSIWLHKSSEDILCIGTCKMDDSLWSYSSRGPGQHYGNAGSNRKPDVVAPTPENGRILYGGQVRVLVQGWGTSGACPQAAGLAALLISATPTITNKDIFDIIRSSAISAGAPWECQGAGTLNCLSAARLLRSGGYAV